MNFSDLFSEGDFRHQMGLRRGSAAEFFKATDSAITMERAAWLRREPRVYSAILPRGESLQEECISLAREWETITNEESAALMAIEDHAERCIRLGELWEPDFLLLGMDAAEKFQLVAGSVCFPSSWSLDEKMGRGLEVIHGPVPGLNETLAAGIGTALRRLAPDAAWLRTNWGFSRSSDANQHPSRRLPKLDETVTLPEIYLRVEHQILTPLPKNRGILFGIRISHHPLANIMANASAVAQLVRNLRSMPEEIAAYKGLETAREKIIALLNL